MMLKSLLNFVFLFIFISCKPSVSNKSDVSKRELDFDTFGKYWYQGKAELNSYDLEQYRYGEKRSGEAVLIFVTEDFSKLKQVKLDNPQANEEDAQKVLKLNLTKKFVTGIYPYSMMMSVFTPVYDSIPAVKITASSQEWCGHTFTQLNRENNKYNALLLSYFENESDQKLVLNGFPEDNLWTLLRLNPNQIPLGNVNLIPGLLDQRLTHTELKAQDATIIIGSSSKNMAEFEAAQLQVLAVDYKSYPRKLRIYFTKAFPYTIAGWEEIKQLKEGGEEVSTAVRKASMMNDYWIKNKIQFEPLRNELKLNK